VSSIKNCVQNYLNSEVAYPFFLVVGDDDYAEAREDLSALGLEIVRVSDYCGSADREPNIDRLKDELKAAENVVIVGLGEYLAIKGWHIAFDTLSTFYNPESPLLNGNKAVLLLRHVTDVVKKLQQNDAQRFNETQNRLAYIGNCDSNIILTCVSGELDLIEASNGFKAVLYAFENGRNNVIAETKMKIAEPLMEFHTITLAYDGIKHLLPTFGVEYEYGTENQWGMFFASLNEAKGDLSKVLGFQPKLIDDFENYIHRTDYKCWLYFIALKLNVDSLENSYLQYVLQRGTKFEQFKSAVLNAIIDIKHTDKRFEKFYIQRAELVKNFSQHEVADFVQNNKIDPAESLYRLTSQTQVECEELIALFSSLDRHIAYKRIENIYPDLTAYLRSYAFIDIKNSEKFRNLMTDYFNRYKWQKVQNYIDDDFLALVEKIAHEREYNFLPSRNDILDKINKDDTFLYWFDALGVEFLGFIQSICEQLKLEITIHIGRAELPTITSKNRDFFENWQDEKSKFHDLSLDKVKHKVDGGYNYESKKLPIHLARELEIISEALNKIAIDLGRGIYKKYLLVSDHGASRLAVIKEQEEKYETDTKGEHSGRCCKVPVDYAWDLPFAAEEDGYLVLANYGRFKNSRKANVEVHGGATLEEVVVPIIEIAVSNPNIQISLVDEVVYVDYKTTVQLMIFSKTKLDNVKVIIDGKLYTAVKISDNHYRVDTDIKKAKKYTADVLEGDTLRIKLQFIAEGKNKSNSDFDDDFNL
jgi:hypothetical protein